MEAIIQQLDFNTLIQLVTLLIILVSLRWQLPSKGDIKRLDDRIDKTNSDMKEGFEQQRLEFKTELGRIDAKIDEARAELKADIQRIDAKQDDFRKDVDERFEQQRIEFKADLQRLEQRGEPL